MAIANTKEGRMLLSRNLTSVVTLKKMYLRMTNHQKIPQSNTHHCFQIKKKMLFEEFKVNFVDKLTISFETTRK